MHPKDSELLPKGTEVIWTRPSHRVTPKVVRAIIREHDFQFQGRTFLNYRVEIVGQKGLYAAYHGDIEPIKPEPLQQ